MVHLSALCMAVAALANEAFAAAVPPAAVEVVPTAPCGVKAPSREFLAAMKDKIENGVFADAENPQPRSAGPLLDDPLLWPENTLVYEFDEASLTTGADQKATIKPEGWKWDMREAMRLLEKDTCIRFRERTAEDKANKVHYVKMGAYQKNACWSYLGYYQYEKNVDDIGATFQPLNVWVNFTQIPNPNYRNGSCGWSSGMHEIMHALGVYHEQSRPDRDTFLNILWDNIEKGKEHNFDKANITMFDSRLDWNSIMMYASASFPKAPGLMTIVKKDGSNFTSNRGHLGEGDKDFLLQLYGCPAATYPRPPLAQFAYTDRANLLSRQFYKVDNMEVPANSVHNATELCAAKCYTEEPKCVQFTVAVHPLVNYCFLSATVVDKSAMVPYPGFTTQTYTRKVQPKF